MQYIVMDLEWNNVYSIKRGGFMNEVIEIGARPFGRAAL